MSLPGLSLRRPVATLMLLVSLLMLGVVAIPRLALDFMPLVEAPFVMVVVPYPGSHPLETMNRIILPLEEELSAIPGVTRLNSDAEGDEARIRVRFDWSARLDLKKMEVREAVDRVRDDLPAEIGHIRLQTFQDGPGDGAILEGRISARRNLSESWELLDQRIRRPLERIRGVAQVQLDGVMPQQLRVELDPEALIRHGIDAATVIRALAANLDMDLGTIRDGAVRLDVRSLGRFRDLESIRALKVGNDVSLRDVAGVALREPEMAYGRHLDREFAVGVQVFKEPAANTVETVDALMERIALIQADPEMEGIHVLVWLNSGQEIRNSLLGLRSAGLFGGLLAIVVLFLFLRRLSTTLIVAVAIPFSLVVACGLMYLMGSVLNVLTMLGLMVGVGMLVDNAVVVIENIYRRQAQGLTPAAAAEQGAREVALAVVAATATSIIVWSWLFTVESGHPMRVYLSAVALTISLAVACSLLISLTFIPLAAARFTSGPPAGPGVILRRLLPAYRSTLAWTLRHRMLALAGLLLLAGSAVIPIAAIEKSGSPKEVERDITLSYRAAGPTTKEKMEAHVNRVEDWLEGRKPELGYSSLYSWYSENGNAVTRVYLPWEEVNRRSLAALQAALEDGLPVIAGVSLEVGDRQRLRNQGGRRKFVSVAVHGEDPEFLRGAAVEVESRLKKLAGLRNLFGPATRGRHEARVLVDPARARAAGFTPRAVADAVGFAFRGRMLQRFAGPHGEVEMLLSLPEELRPGLSGLDRLTLPRPDGTGVPLAAVATVQLDRMDEEIEREDRRTTQFVTVEFDDEVTTVEGKQRIETALAGFLLPEGYAWDWGSRGRDDDEALGIMVQGVILSLVMVLLLMAALFESALQPLAILITLPLAFFGAFWALWLLGYELEVVAFMGVIILIGMVVNNGIVMVDHVNSLRRQGASRVDALLAGCGDRLRPVLMTTITTVFGLLPLALSGFTVAGVYVDSMAVAIIGGLASSTIFTLLALPVWYTLVEDLGAVVLRALPRRQQAPAASSAPGS